jgi:putative ABC transport system ATP-binding protein
VLSVRGLTKSFPGEVGPVCVLDGVDLDLARGETAALVGESGSGKSTLLHLIAGLDQPDGGTISVDGSEISGLNDEGRSTYRRDTVALVFQQFNLIPSLNVRDNVAFQSRLNGRHDPARERELVEALGLGGLEVRYPENLSGGQQQRVAIARCMAAAPKLLLADEPTGNLDEQTSDAVIGTMLDLVKSSGTTLLMVTHSNALSSRLGKVFTLSGGALHQ